MNNSEIDLPADLSPDHQGIPESVEGPPPGVPGDNADDAFPLPGDEPQVVLGRTTAAEERAGETLDERLAQEQTDDLAVDPDSAGRLMAPESGVDEMDETSEEVAFQASESSQLLTAEEDAMHVIPDADVMGPGSPGDGYLDG